jgi:hypothetical protein
MVINMDENFNERPAFDVDCPKCHLKMTETERRHGYRYFECECDHWVVKVTTRQKIAKMNWFIAAFYTGITGFAIGAIGFLIWFNTTILPKLSKGVF